MNKSWIRILLLLQGLLFISAALMHFGILTTGYEHAKAGTAETVIGIVLLSGLVISLVRPIWTHIAGLTVQIFALFGTLVGIFTIAIGIGPRTLPDLVYHICMVSLLIIGLVVTARSRGMVHGGSESLAR